MSRAVQLRIPLGVSAIALLARPAARAMRGEYLWRAVPQAQITNLDRVLDCHGLSVRQFVMMDTSKRGAPQMFSDEANAHCRHARCRRGVLAVRRLRRGVACRSNRTSIRLRIPPDRRT
jgi:hypothetical protein